MEEALSKIRPHTSSSLPHQKTPAKLLLAIEATSREQNTDVTPTAYFAALLTTLDATIKNRDTALGDGDVLPAELYLLALISPFVSESIIRTNLQTLLSLTVPLFSPLNQHAPALRSQLSLYHCIFQALDRSHLETQGIRQAFASVLNLCLDPRPKVRKKAADVIRDLLASPPAPLARHPYAEPVAEWIKASLTEVNSGPLTKGKSGKSPNSQSTESAIHLLAFLRPILLNLPPSSLPSIVNLLLKLPRLGNTFLSQSAYSTLSELFILITDDDSSNVVEQISEVLKVVLTSPPSKSDFILSSAWVKVLGDAMLAYKVNDPESCSKELGKVWKAVWGFLDSNDANTRKATSKSLATLCQCFSPGLISLALNDAGETSTIRKCINQISKAIDALAYARSIPELLSVVSAMITNLQYRENSRSPTAAEWLILPLVKHIGELRTQKGFEYKESVDATLSVAMQILGPEVILSVLPLNLEPANREAGSEPRAFLLPLLAQPHASSLEHFVSYFVPLSERMFDLQQNAESEGRQAESKVWSVLVGQVWSGLVGYCYRTPNLKQVLTPALSQLLSQLLYSQSELRPAILRALKVLVDSNVTLADSSNEVTSSALSPQEAKDNIAFLRTQAESWLAVFFNVFGTVGRDSRGMVGDVISSWASITDEEDISKAYSKVVQLFRTNLSKSNSSPAINNSFESESMTATSQDIILLLLPHLKAEDSTALFQLCLGAEVLCGRENGVQKRGYKILTKLVENKQVTIDPQVILQKLDELMEGLTAAAKKDRYHLLALLISSLPSNALHLIPPIIPEVVLGTKEPSEKARTAAFDVILAMGRKMNEGGIVKRSMMDSMDEDSMQDAAADVEEFLTMIAGGLAGASPHMISATTTAISRLIFEFKDTISPKMHTEILTTMLVFLTSANREIVKSVLGFVKLIIHTLPTDLIRPHLPDLVKALLHWSHDHKNHFKVKVRHIFERMLRRFSWDEVYSCAGGEDAAKVLINIKKRKERAKRKKANKTEEDEQEPTTKRGDAFEDVLYGSESEMDDTDDDEPAAHSVGTSKTRKSVQNMHLRIDDDEPMDLLQGAKITSGAEKHRRKPGQEVAYFKTDQDTGKIVIDEDSDSEKDKVEANITDAAGGAYHESITSVDGFTRGLNGRVKFNKDTKKRRRGAEELEDVEMADPDETTTKAKGTKRRPSVKLGQEFKAKRAGGDVKKGGVDPYAYMSLSQAAKRRNSIGITGKR